MIESNPLTQQLGLRGVFLWFLYLRCWNAYITLCIGVRDKNDFPRFFFAFFLFIIPDLISKYFFWSNAGSIHCHIFIISGEHLDFACLIFMFLFNILKSEWTFQIRACVCVWGWKRGDIYFKIVCL